MTRQDFTQAPHKGLSLLAALRYAQGMTAWTRITLFPRRR